MDPRQALADQAVRDELISRLGELRAALPSGLEGLDGGRSIAELADQVVSAAEGAGGEDLDDGLEAIILRFTRPVLLVQQSSFAPAMDGFPDSEVLTQRLTSARSSIETCVSSVGRVELRNHRLDWAGTAWMVAPDLAVTNRHVAEYFANASNEGFAFRAFGQSPPVRASIDWRKEYQQREESLATVVEVVWMEPDEGFDVALLRVTALDGPDLPAPIPLMDKAQVDAANLAWIAVVGYPDRSLYNDAADQQRIFDGIYGVKRLAPGQITAVSPDGLLFHDATTLGGNSGSALVDLATGRAAGLHFGGIEHDHNTAVQAPVISDLLARHG